MKKKKGDFTINLAEIPNGLRKPVELCEYLERLRRWRDNPLAGRDIFIN